MMRQVWKFDVDENESPVHMPECAQILSAGFQGDTLVVWALVDIESRLTPRKICVRGTGHNIRAENLFFIQTVFKDSLVFHVFENIEL
jgi:hypothetical protein